MGMNRVRELHIEYLQQISTSWRKILRQLPRKRDGKVILKNKITCNYSLMILLTR
jgi:hypothetical protein